MQVKTCVFNLNRAKKTAGLPLSGYGGVFFYDSTNSASTFTVLGSTSYTNNRAEVAGGVYYFTLFPISEGGATVVYTNNSAPYGNDRAAYATQLVQLAVVDDSVWLSYVRAYNQTILGQNLTRVLAAEREQDAQPERGGEHAADRAQRALNPVVSGQTSGAIFYPPFVLVLKDEWGQVVSIDQSSSLVAYSGTSTIDGKYKEGFGNKTAFSCVNGQYILYPFSITRYPGTTASVFFNSTAINASNPRSGLVQQTLVTVNETLRTCKKGEKLTTSYACVACPAVTKSQLLAYLDHCFQ